MRDGRQPPQSHLDADEYNRGMNTRLAILLPLVAVAGMAPSALTQERERSQIPDLFTWNLSEI